MKTETINGVQVTTCYGYTMTGSTADLEPMASLDALRARIMEDTPAASRFMVQQVLNAKEENAQRAIAYSMATHPLQPGDEGYHGWIVVARAEVRLQCCRGETMKAPHKRSETYEIFDTDESLAITFEDRAREIETTT